MAAKPRARYWQPEEVRQCRFVFIGRDLDREELVAGFQRCKVLFARASEL